MDAKYLAELWKEILDKELYLKNKEEDTCMKGYKVFEPDWTCREKQYTCPGTFEENVEPSCCNRGMHFCTNLADCFDYYHFNPKNKVAEVVALGDVDSGYNKFCTNKLQIVRELSWEEVLRLVNAGNANTGLRNSGNCNSGNRNSGSCNSGDGNSSHHNTGNWNSGNCNTGNYNSSTRNSGNWNSGNCNSGDGNSGIRNSGNWNSGSNNSGNCNSGDWNSGHFNSGNCNSGTWNSGDWNKTDFSSGCFNTEKTNIMLFNKPSNWTLQDWHSSKAKSLLDSIPKQFISWTSILDMTEEEKTTNPTCKVTRGYLKKFNESKEVQKWWNELSEDNKKIIKDIPNFDAEIFKEITGIQVD